MNVNRITEASDFIIKGCLSPIVIAVEYILATDTAGFPYTKHGRRVHKIGLRKTGDVLPVKIVIDFCKFAAFNICMS